MDKITMEQKGTDTLTVSRSLIYASPAVVTNFLFYPVQILLAGIYAKYFGLSLATIAVIVFAARLFDAVTDPLIGYYSDRYRARTGTRKPWIIVGGIGLVISSYFLWTPPANVTGSYFLIWYFAFYLAWTIIDIPHTAWGGELASTSHDKTRVYSIRAFCLYFGLFLFAVVPLLPIFKGKGFTPETLLWSVLASAVIMLPTLIICIKLTPNGRESVQVEKESPQLVLKAIFTNKPLLNLLAGFFPISAGYGLYMGLSFIFADAYLGLGEHLPMIFVLSTLIGLAGTGVTYQLSARLGKIKIYRLAVIVSAMAMAGHALLKPESEVLIPLAVLTGMFYFSNAMVLGAVPSLLSDIADYGTWKFGTDRAATYFAVYAFMAKAIVGIGGACGLGLINWYGFDATAISHSGNSTFGLRLAIAYLPTILMLVSLIAIAKMPINARRHRLIKMRLDRCTYRKKIHAHNPRLNP